MKTKKRNRLIEATYYNRNPKEDYAVCVTERDDWGNRGDRVITIGSKEYCENWIEDYCQRYSWNRGMHYIKSVTEVDDQQFKEDYFGNNNYEDDFADLEDMLVNHGVSVNRSDVFGESTKKKNIVKLTENELKKVITESVKRILREAYGQYEQTPYNNSSSIDADISNIEAAVERDRERAEIDNIVKKGWCSYANIKEVLCGADDDSDDYDGLLSFPIIMNDKEEFNFRGRRRFKSTEKTFTPDSFCKPLKLNKPLRNWTFAVGYGGFADESDEYMQLSIYVSVKKTQIDIAVVTDNPNVDTELSKGSIENAICKEAKRRYEEKIMMQRGR